MNEVLMPFFLIGVFIIVVMGVTVIRAFIITYAEKEARQPHEETTESKISNLAKSDNYLRQATSENLKWFGLKEPAIFIGNFLVNRDKRSGSYRSKTLRKFSDSLAKDHNKRYNEK